MKKLLIVGVLSAVLMGCSDPHSTVIPTESSKWGEIRKDVDKLPDDEKAILTQYIMRKTMGEAFGGEPIPPGTTIGDAIKEQKNLVAQEEAKQKAQRDLKAKIEAENAAVIAKMDATLTAALISKKSVQSRYSNTVDSVDMVIAFENKSDKKIAGFKGVVHFKNMFGDNVKSLTLSNDQGVAAKGTYKQEGHVDINQFIDEDVSFANLELNKLKFDFEPTLIMFEDGTKIELKQVES